MRQGFPFPSRREIMASCCGPKSASSPSTSSTAINTTLPVAIIGGGPVGLAAAAHLLQRGLKPVVFEAGTTVGTSILEWGHVRMFSTWQYNIDAASRELLAQHGWTAPNPNALPTGRMLVKQYLEPLAATPEIAACLRVGTRVLGIARTGTGKIRDTGRDAQPFEVRFADDQGKEGRLLAGAVIVATGTWGHPSPAGASGLPALGEKGACARLRYGMPDVLGAEQSRYAGKRVLVLGSGHSALGTLIDLAALTRQAPDTRIVWAIRSANPIRAYGGGDADQLPQRGALGTRLKSLVEEGAIQLLTSFAVDAMREENGQLQVQSEDGRNIVVDEMIVATGLRPDLQILQETRLDLDAALECPRSLAPLIDPNLHSCGTVRPHGAQMLAQPDAGLFLAGMVSYGRAPTFLLATGYEQVRSIAAWIAGDLQAARRVELVLPETGVCSTRPVADRSDKPAASCCTPALQTKQETSQCC
jgi:thioredoxin reductase